MGLAVVLFGCGAAHDDLARTKDDASTGTPVFVVSGGFLSCKLPWSKPTSTHTFQNLSSLMTELGGDSPAYVATCFNLDHDSLRYQTDGQSSAQTTTPDQFYDLVAQRVAAAGPGARLILVGHSWGGWLVMANAERLRQIAPVSYLATLDPISWQNCPPAVVEDAILHGSAAGSPDPECTEAPSDLSAADPAIDAAAGHWDHFYQDTFAYLHSGPIAAATTNTHITFDNLGSMSAWEAHVDMDRDPRIFSVISASLH